MTFSREEKILEFLKNNHGCSKEDVIKFTSYKGFSSRKTTFKIIEDFKNKGIISLSKIKPNSREYIIKIIKDNPLNELDLDILTLKKLFNTLIDKIKNIPLPLAYTSEDKFYTFITPLAKVFALIQSITKLIVSILNDINFSFIPNVIKSEEELYQANRKINSIITEFYGSSYHLKKNADKNITSYAVALSNSNNSPAKVFLWSNLIFFEYMTNEVKGVLIENIKPSLYALMKAIYDFGKKYTSILYDDIVYDPYVYRRKEFQDHAFVEMFQNELKKISYIEFMRLICGTNFLNYNMSHAGLLLHKIKKHDKYWPYSAQHIIFDKLIMRVNARLKSELR